MPEELRGVSPVLSVSADDIWFAEKARILEISEVARFGTGRFSAPPSDFVREGGTLCTGLEVTPERYIAAKSELVRFGGDRF